MIENVYYADDWKAFCNSIDEKRSELERRGIFCNNDEVKEFKLESIEIIPEGRFNVWVEGVLVECYFHYGKGLPLWVFLNGAYTGKEEKPQFRRWSYCSFLEGSMLNIADPMYRDFDDLKIGWYYGNKQKNYRDSVVQLVDKVMQILSMNRKDVIFFASSAGGAAAIECAARLGETRVLVINSQIRLADHICADTFRKITGIDLNEQDLFFRNDALIYLTRNPNCVLVINARSEEDMVQLSHVTHALNLKVKYGLNVFNNIVVWIYDAECDPYFKPHSCQENIWIWPFLERLADFLFEKSKIKKMEGIYLQIGELWNREWSARRDKCMLERTKEELRNNVLQEWIKQKRAGCKLSERLQGMKIEKVAIYGMGILGEEILRELSDENEIEILYCLDRKRRGTVYGKTVYDPSSDLESPDAIIVTVFGENDGIKDYLNKKMGDLNILFLSDLLRSE